jgi:SAM-dependent methyltransferase
MKREPFLDLGASAVPHRSATHAVDRDSKTKVVGWIKEYTEDSGTPTTKEKLERKLKSMDYRFGFNYNTQKFPWPNNSFKVVYSNASLGRYGNPKNAFKESYRVLKHGGKLIIDSFGGSREQIQKVKTMIVNTGFTNVTIKLDKDVYIHNGKENYSGKLTATKP